MSKHSDPTAPSSEYRIVHAPAVEEADLSAASAPFVGRWSRLISTTNWEKGRIILDWRQALIDAGAPAAQYSDEAWSRLVGAVTPQHVGRLRRVFQRFGKVYQRFEGLYWSHFQAAVDWDDAEMYLEGAVQSGWSVAQMRQQRWEAMGVLEQDRPQEVDLTPADLDEDAEPLDPGAREGSRETPGGRFDEASAGPRPEGPDFGDESDAEPPAWREPDPALSFDDAIAEPPASGRAMQSLPPLPEDVAEAFDAMKLAILRHRAEGWKAISREEMAACLDALKELALAAAPQTAPLDAVEAGDAGAPF